MYGFAEEANDADDVYLSAESIESGIYEYESKIPAIKAKIKLLQNHGFMDEGIHRHFFPPFSIFYT